MFFALLCLYDPHPELKRFKLDSQSIVIYFVIYQITVIKFM